MKTLKDSITEVSGKKKSEEIVVINDRSTSGYRCSVNTESVETSIRYQCPMKCEGEKTYDSPGKCPGTNMYMIPVGGGYIFY